MKTDTFQKNQSLPRYTSYPTAPHFHENINRETYKSWLKELNADSELSLYLHIPFCDTLCWFCGCHTKITRQYNPVSTYLKSLLQEALNVSSHISAAARVTHIHFGGGSPTILSTDDFSQTISTLKNSFNIIPDAHFAVEIDPRGLTLEHITSMTAAGVNRASIGIQDFNPKVQEAINRIQTFEETSEVITQLRENGGSSVNIDLLYGLPYQTLDSLKETIDKVISLKPERISFFGYAHVPWMKKHQSMIPEEALPGIDERMAQSEYSSRLLQEAGYVRIGFDHFAHPDDHMADALKNGTLRRNFQGYTTDNSTAVIGLGASAIGQFPQGYIQNRPEIGRYQAEIMNLGLATVRGYELNDDDRIRAFIIERLMCDLKFSEKMLQTRFGTRAAPLILEARQLLEHANNDYVVPTDDGFQITEKGRPYIRMICAHFDAYLKSGKGRHSLAV